MDPLTDTLVDLARLLLIGLALYLALTTWMVMHRLRRPPRRTYAWALSRGIPGDPGERDPPRGFTDDRRTLAGVACGVWSIRGDAPDGPVVFMTPGWGDSRQGALPRLEAFASRASRVIVWDLPGMGESGGLSALGTSRDRRALVDLVVGEAGRERVVLFGWSLGGGLSIAAGVELESRGVDIAGVIAEAPYRRAWTPARRVMREAGFPHRVSVPIAFALLGVRLGEGVRWRGFDRAGWAARLRAPLVVVHGDADLICPAEDGREIASASPDGRAEVIEGGAHNDLWGEAFAPRARAAVEGFLARAG